MRKIKILSKRISPLIGHLIRLRTFSVACA
jgi:hypothetical protein